MEIKEENKEILIYKSNPSLNEKISSDKEINPSQILLNQSSTIKSYNPQKQVNYSKTDLGENDITNIKLDENIDEEIGETVKITNRIIKSEKSKTGGGTFYEKK